MEWDTAAGQAVLLGAGGRGGALRRPRAARLRQGGLREPVLHRPRPGRRPAGRPERRCRSSSSSRRATPRPAIRASRWPSCGGATGEARSLIRRSWEAAMRGAGRRPGRGRHRRRPHRRRRPRLRRRGGDDAGHLPQRHRALRGGLPRPRRRLRHRGQPAGRRAADPAVVRLRADRGDAGRSGARRWRRRCCAATPRRWRASSRTAATAGSAPPPRSSTATGRALYFSKEVLPYTGRPLGPRRGHPGLPPRRRLCLPRRGARAPIRTGRSDRWRPGKGWSSSASWRTACRCTASRSRPAGRAFWELNNPTGRAADRGDPPPARPALSLGGGPAVKRSRQLSFGRSPR